MTPGERENISQRAPFFFQMDAGCFWSPPDEYILLNAYITCQYITLHVSFFSQEIHR